MNSNPVKHFTIRLSNFQRFLFAAVITLMFHFLLTEFAAQVCKDTAPPNISPDADQGWMDGNYVPAYADYSTAYALGILLLGGLITGITLYVAWRKKRFIEFWTVLVLCIPIALYEFVALVFMHPWV